MGERKRGNGNNTHETAKELIKKYFKEEERYWKVMTEKERAKEGEGRGRNLSSPRSANAGSKTSNSDSLINLNTPQILWRATTERKESS